MTREENKDFEMLFFERLVKENPNYVDALILLAEVYTKNSLYDKGLQVDKRLAKLKTKDPVVHYNLACSFALVGEKDEALVVLKKAIEFGYTDFDHLKQDQDFKTLRSDPR